MIVCLCEGVSDREIINVIEDGATTLEGVGMACGAGTCCGGCIDIIEQLLLESATADRVEDERVEVFAEPALTVPSPMAG